MHPLQYLKNVAPFWFLAPPGFWPSLLLNPGDGPVKSTDSWKTLEVARKMLFLKIMA